MLELFEQDDLANQWRKVTFQSMLSVDGSQRSIGYDIEGELSAVVEKAEALALQFGIHSCKLVLVNPSSSWSGDPAPGLVKISRDKNGASTSKVIVEHKEKP